jgi:hypothetical protein
MSMWNAYRTGRAEIGKPNPKTTREGKCGYLRKDGPSHFNILHTGGHYRSEYGEAVHLLFDSPCFSCRRERLVARTTRVGWDALARKVANATPTMASFNDDAGFLVPMMSW